MKIIAEKVLEDWWATPSEFEDMSDQDILDLIYEDICAFLEDAKFTVDRT